MTVSRTTVTPVATVSAHPRSVMRVTSSAMYGSPVPPSASMTIARSYQLAGAAFAYVGRAAINAAVPAIIVRRSISIHAPIVLVAGPCICESIGDGNRPGPYHHARADRRGRRRGAAAQDPR